MASAEKVVTASDLEGINEADILQMIVQEIQTKSQKPLVNFGTKLQTSVGIILRPASNTPAEVVAQMRWKLSEIRQRDENHYITERLPHSAVKEILDPHCGSLQFEMLLAQRPTSAGGGTDMYSHQVRFLGGKCEGTKEDDLQAVVRAVRAESGFDLQDVKASVVYLGSLPKNFYTGRVESRETLKLPRDVLSRAHLFVILDNQATQKMRFKQTVEIVKWVPFRQILMIDPKKDVKERIIENPKQLEGLLPEFLGRIVSKGLRQIVFISLDVGMPRNMWGLHAAMIVYMMSVFVKCVELTEKRDSSKKVAMKKYTKIVDRWQAIFDRFQQTYSTQDSHFIGNFLIKHYFNSWKTDFHKKHMQGDGIDYSFMMLIGSTSLMFALDCYYKTLANMNKPKL